MRTICDAGLQSGRAARMHNINARLVGDEKKKKRPMAPSLRNLAVVHSPSLTIEHEIEMSVAGQ